MGFVVPITEPTELRAGDTWLWLRSLGDYPASVWTLTYHFRNASAYFDVTATADGDDHSVDVPMATTAAYAPGHYEWAAFVTDGSTRHEVDTGRIEVLADVSATQAYDGRTDFRKLIDAIDAILQSRASSDQIDAVATAVGDSSVTRKPSLLLEWRSKFLMEAQRQEGTGGTLRRIVARFPNG